jgi:hypothetical protein
MDDIFLTFDMDWACDEVIAHTLDILEARDVSATFLITNETPVLERIRANGRFELGIHPNFNKTLSGEENKPLGDIIDDIMRIVPEAVTERAHALTHNTLISFELRRRGILYDSNVYIPFYSDMAILPFSAPSGITAAPFFFADDIYFFHQNEKTPAKMYLKRSGLKVFDFHPIHIYLNAASFDTYLRSKEVSRNPEELKKLINTDIYGAADFLNDVINLGKKHSYNFKKIKDIGVICK